MDTPLGVPIILLCTEKNKKTTTRRRVQGCNSTVVSHVPLISQMCLSARCTISFLHSSTASCCGTAAPPPPAPPVYPCRCSWRFLLRGVASPSPPRPCVPSRHESVRHLDDPSVPFLTLLNGPRSRDGAMTFRTMLTHCRHRRLACSRSGILCAPNKNWVLGRSKGEKFPSYYFL